MVCAGALVTEAARRHGAAARSCCRSIALHFACLPGVFAADQRAAIERIITPPPAAACFCTKRSRAEECGRRHADLGGGPSELARWAPKILGPIWRPAMNEGARGDRGASPLRPRQRPGLDIVVHPQSVIHGPTRLLPRRLGAGAARPARPAHADRQRAGLARPHPGAEPAPRSGAPGAAHLRGTGPRALPGAAHRPRGARGGRRRALRAELLANEVAVAAFLDRRIRFPRSRRGSVERTYGERCAEDCKVAIVDDDVHAIDGAARAAARRIIGNGLRAPAA